MVKELTNFCLPIKWNTIQQKKKMTIDTYKNTNEPHNNYNIFKKKAKLLIYYDLIYITFQKI